MHLRLHHTTYYTLLALLALACSEDEDPQTTIEEPTDEIATGVYQVANITMDTDASSSGNAETFYYSLENNQQVSAAQAQTANWDLAFLGTYNSSIAANNGKATYSPGYGGPGKGALYLVINEDVDGTYYDSPGEPLTQVPARTLFDQAFNAVTAVPVADEAMLTNEYIGLDYFSGAGDGWCYYDFYGAMFPDRPDEEKAHVAYAMPRPLIVKTALGHYAKVIIYSLYEDAPEDPDRSNNPGFLTFKFAIQKDGTTNLDIPEE